MTDLNWVDYLLLVILIFYAYEGYSRGFIGEILDLISFIISFIVGLRFYGIIGGFLVSTFAIPQGFSNAIGFFIATFITEVFLGSLTRYLFNLRLLQSLTEGAISRKINNIFGIFPGILSGIILISFVLVLIVSFPVAGPIKNSVSSSKISSFFLSNAQGLEKKLDLVFGGAINETINFLTIEPKSDESVSLRFKAENLTTDHSAEQYMLSLVNKERTKRGLGKLVFDEQLAKVGRAHCSDMFKRGYFSHYTPEGLSPFDRMENAGIKYGAAGENLALSPNTDLAMQGLMNSPGHKANILSVNFGRVGIGVIDGGIYGEMFCQEFTD